MNLLIYFICLSMKKDGRYHSFKIQGLFHNFQDLVDMLLVRVGTAGWF
jgi:fructose-1,6-bisphosphatase